LPESRTKPRYRPDLDGLRAVAILAVILFHAGIPGVQGGFVGVDIFFVISGFLISSILYRQMEAGTFTFRSFYERRAKRILPALVAVLLVTYVFAALLFTPRELRSFGAQVLATLGCSSNLFFWKTTGYFEARTELKPLLMTWSLGVEEQFYIVFPVLVVLLFRRARKALFYLLVLLSTASFLLSIYQTAHHPKSAFYLLPSRWWELGAGTLLAAFFFRRRSETTSVTSSRLFTELLGLAGASCLLASILLMRRTTPFPGLSSLPSVVGAVLIILAEGSWINRRILASRPLVALGLVSYSWYLWHWPLLSFARNSTDGNLPILSSLAIVVLALGFATFSYFFIEQPFRKAPSHRTLLWRYGALTLAVAIPATAILALHGWPGRYPAADRIEAEARPPLNNPCLLLEEVSLPPVGLPCIPGSGVPTLAVLGDSHAAAISDELAREAVAHGWAVAQYTKVSCPPTGAVGVHSNTIPSLSQQCPAFYASALPAIVANAAIRTVLLTGLWTDYVDHTHPDRHYNPPGEDLDDVSEDASFSNFATGLNAVVASLTADGKRVILAMDVPEVPYDPLLHALTTNIHPRRLLGKLVYTPIGTDGLFAHYPSRSERRTAELLQEVARRNHATYLDLSAPLCANNFCRFELQGEPLYYDTGHLSSAGARFALRNADIFK
jgi:peptidoglycan/LPS O-acetylase OafA/YrhL